MNNAKKILQKSNLRPTSQRVAILDYILEKHKAALSDYFKAEKGFDLIELGAGDGKKCCHRQWWRWWPWRR